MFADSLKLPYPLLSDFPDLKGIRSYDAFQRLGDAGRLFARRAFFLVDHQGIIRRQWLVENKEVFPSEAILKAAREIAGKP